MPHSIPSLNDQLGQGPNVAICYFRINGYASECERTFFLNPPSAEEKELFYHMIGEHNPQVIEAVSLFLIILNKNLTRNIRKSNVI